MNIFIAGHNGMVGSSLVRELNHLGNVKANFLKQGNKLDLLDQKEFLNSLMMRK